MNKLAILVVLAAAVILLLLFSMGVFSGRGRGRPDGQRGTAFGNLSEYANNSETQVLFMELRDARRAGNQEKVDNITLELEKMGVEVPSGRGPRDFSPGDI